MPFRPAHGSYTNSVEDGNIAECHSGQQTIEHLSMCRGLISHNSRVSIGAIIIIIRIRAKGGVITRATRIMNGGTIRTTCHHPE